MARALLLGVEQTRVEEKTMATIIQYTDRQTPQNQYPLRIVSPRNSSRCCLTGMEDVGEALTEAPWVLQYRRCHQCGFAVRLVVRALPDAQAIASLQSSLKGASLAGLE